MPVHVSHGRIDMEWCDTCNTSGLLVTNVYALAGDTIHLLGRVAVKCVTCGQAAAPR